MCVCVCVCVCVCARTVRCLVAYLLIHRAAHMQAQMGDPKIASDPKEFQPIAQKAAELQPQVDCLARMQRLEGELEGARAMLREAEGR